MSRTRHHRFQTRRLGTCYCMTDTARWARYRAKAQCIAEWLALEGPTADQARALYDAWQDWQAFCREIEAEMRDVIEISIPSSRSR